MTNDSARKHRVCFAISVAAIAAVLLLHPPAATAAGPARCTCGDGHTLEAGAVSYSHDSGREIITRVETEGNAADRPCRTVWISSTQIRPRGSPYQFALERRKLREQRYEGCGDLAERFARRSKTYDFVFDTDSKSIKEMKPDIEPQIATAVPDPKAQSNKTLWDAIVVEDSEDASARIKPEGTPLAPREFNRTSWVFSRKNVKVHYVGMLKGLDQRQRLVPLKETREVKAGQLGQIEAANADSAIVRFYQGSRIERFAKSRTAFRRWYDDMGGPYKEAEDDLYTPLQAYIVQVSLDDLIEVNDYLDKGQTDRTGSVNLWQAYATQ